MSRFSDEVKRYGAIVEDRLLAFLKDKQMDANAIMSEMYDILIDFTIRGGKRIRPLLVYYGHRSVYEPKDITDVACAVELLHVFLLIHDDIIDMDVIRRGGPTVNKSYLDLFEKKYEGDSDHYANSMAILVGDLAYTLAIELLREHPSAMGIVTDVIERTISGEALDIQSEFEELTENELLDMMRQKTAYYSFYMPLAIGATLAGSDELNDIERISINLGLAFQMQDDILDIYSKKTGKDQGSDILQGKMTLIYLNAMEKANKRDRAFLRDQLGVADSLLKIQKIIKKTGAYDYATEMVKVHSDNAKEQILRSSMKECTKEFLVDLVDNLIKRDN